MLTRTRAVATALMPLMATLTAAPAHAQVEPIRLTYGSDAGCPTESQFLADVAARTDRARRVGGDQPARTFDVQVSTSTQGRKSRGILLITSLNGSVSRREVTGETCAGVVSALALITALAIDARATTREGPVSGPTEEPKPPPAAPPPASSPGPPDSLEAPLARRLRWAMGADGAALAGFLPEWGLGGGMFVDVATAGSGLLAPAFRASVLATATNASFSAAIGSRLMWLFARVELCPARLPMASALVLRGCAAMDAGILRSEGTGLPSVATDARPWLSPGAFGRVEWSLPGGAWIEGGGGVSMPLYRYVFSYNQGGAPGEIQVSRVAALGGALTFGGGYHFP